MITAAYRETFLAFLSVPVSPARLDFACNGEIRHDAYRARTSGGPRLKTRTRAVILQKLFRLDSL